MSDSKNALNQPDATAQDGMNLLCDGFRDQLMQNIQYLRQGDGRLVLDTLDETGQWHATQMNGFLKTLVLPPHHRRHYCPAHPYYGEKQRR